MSSDDKTDEAAARKARADAIRRIRDLRNAGIDAPPAPKPESPETPRADERGDASSNPTDDRASYVDWIDRKMRERDRVKPTE